VSTFFVTHTVVVVSIVGATVVAVRAPEQPAMLRAHKRRERVRRARRPRPATARVAATPRVVVPSGVDAGAFTDTWAPASSGPTVWFRVRSGVVLTILLAVIGALVAMAIAGFVVAVALALRSAVS
jgi:hypothetical protein